MAGRSGDSTPGRPQRGGRLHVFVDVLLDGIFVFIDADADCVSDRHCDAESECNRVVGRGHGNFRRIDGSDSIWTGTGGDCRVKGHDHRCEGAAAH
jgi:hypothetical protein